MSQTYQMAELGSSTDSGLAATASATSGQPAVLPAIEQVLVNYLDSFKFPRVLFLSKGVKVNANCSVKCLRFFGN